MDAARPPRQSGRDHADELSIMRPSEHVNGARLWNRLMHLAQFGARADGGVDRQALSEDEIPARAQVVAWGGELGLKPFHDPAGNLFLRLEGRDPALPPVLAGSHIDSQPTGGKFDGALGVMAWKRFSRSAARGGVLEPLALPLLSLILVGAQALPFLVVPGGTSIRPMAWGAYVVAAALGLAALSLARSLSALKRGGNRAVCAAAMVLSLAIVVVPSLSIKAVAGIKGFRLGP